ncbi:MAG TPA: hypothetical protein VFJ58_18090 [Armatimonadota bacterium]|nr:hypothetical protein [Armatimonadota bacterium]
MTGRSRPTWADLQRLPRPPQGLEQRISWTLELYPCMLLFVHRDAEHDPRERRVREIMAAIEALNGLDSLPVVCVVPVRMQEAWLLTDEIAIRRAAGNPNGGAAITLPSIKKLESLPDPKTVLHTMLREASGLHGRRLRQFNEHSTARLVVDHCEGFSALRELSAFAALESDVKRIVRRLGFQTR